MFRKTQFRPASVTLAVVSHRAERPPQSLAEAVQDIVLKLDETSLGRLNGGHFGWQPKLMLGLMVYCYARQILSSTDIEIMLARDSACSQLCQDELPSARSIAQFRNDHRLLIQDCLRSALLFLARRKVEDGTVTRINEAFIAEEARRRIIMAMCADSLQFEGHALTEIA